MYATGLPLAPAALLLRDFVGNHRSSKRVVAVNAVGKKVERVAPGGDSERIVAVQLQPLSRVCLFIY